MRVAVRSPGSRWLSLRATRRRAAALFRTLPLTLLPLPCQAEDRAGHLSLMHAVTGAENHAFASFTLTAGVLAFAVLCAVLLMRTRSRTAAESERLRNEIATLEGALERTRTLLRTEPQAVAMWPAEGGTPEIIGEAAAVTGADPSIGILEFSNWLSLDDARELKAALTALREDGESFTLSLTALAAHPVEAEGRVVGGRAVLRLKRVSGIARKLTQLSADHRALQNQFDALRALVDAVPAAIWVRDENDTLAFANKAYADAVESTPAQAIVHHTELLDHRAREQMRAGIAEGTVYKDRVHAVAAGERRTLDVFAVAAGKGSAGIAVDATEVEMLNARIARMNEAHRSTLDQLATAVAIFDGQRRLTFYNAAYAQLWELDSGFLDQQPTDTAILERLRALRRLPEQQDFRQWRTQVHEAYQSVETHQHEWHLPDGRTIRVVITPNSEGGVTYLFDDVTERLELVRRFDALIRVQGETLDNLGEAVAVFGSDGRLRLSNPAFAQMWRLEGTALAERPHIEALAGRFRQFIADDATLQALRASVTALDGRAPMRLRIERTDGDILDCSAQPLPDGATLVTFIDVTASVNVERALVERNEALVAADNLKEAFLQHMSYELRSPLTNIIGFAYFLDDEKTGPLNERQREYLGYITYSTNALLAIVDSILDLATLEAGAMTLDLGEVEIRKTMEDAAQGVQDRLAKDEIALDLRAAPDIGTFVADERRVRQILYNLLSNAVGFSPRGGTVTFAAERRPDAVVFTVSDQGPGIPDERKDKVFDSFETQAGSSRHRGIGLGLSLVRSFMELHGGSVRIDSMPGHGTTVTCIFPLERELTLSAAE